MRQMRTACITVVDKPQQRRHRLGDLRIYGMTTELSKWILKKQGMRMWTGFNCLEYGPVVGY
jgi:hypothetical protein